MSLHTAMKYWQLYNPLVFFQVTGPDYHGFVAERAIVKSQETSRRAFSDSPLEATGACDATREKVLTG